MLTLLIQSEIGSWSQSTLWEWAFSQHWDPEESHISQLFLNVLPVGPILRLHSTQQSKASIHWTQSTFSIQWAKSQYTYHPPSKKSKQILKNSYVQNQWGAHTWGSNLMEVPPKVILCYRILQLCGKVRLLSYFCKSGFRAGRYPTGVSSITTIAHQQHLLYRVGLLLHRITFGGQQFLR